MKHSQAPGRVAIRGLGTERQYNVDIDGLRVGSVRGKTAFEVEPGTHTITVSQWMARSRPYEITIQAGATADLLMHEAGKGSEQRKSFGAMIIVIASYWISDRALEIWAPGSGRGLRILVIALVLAGAVSAYQLVTRVFRGYAWELRAVGE